jgi:hypothetical protein
VSGKAVAGSHPSEMTDELPKKTRVLLHGASRQDWNRTTDE